MTMYQNQSNQVMKLRLWNQQVQTDRTIPNNKPDVIIRDNKKEHNVHKCCNLGDISVIKKETEKILKI